MISDISGSTLIPHCSAQLPAVDVFRPFVPPGQLSVHALSRGYVPLDFMGCQSFSDLVSFCDLLTSVRAPHGSEIDRQGDEQVKLGCPMRRPLAEVNVAGLYRLLQDMGFKFGPQFALIKNLWVGDEEAIYIVRIPPTVAAEGMRFHPAVMDACVT